MARRGTLPALALLVLTPLALPVAASASVRIAVTTDQPTGTKQLEVSGGVGDDEIVLAQENQPNTPAIAIFSDPNEGFQLGAGCGVFGGPPRARCATNGITRIVVNLAEGTRPATSPVDTNEIDLTGVTQLTPDGSAPLAVVLSGGPGPDTVTDGPGRLL